MAFVDELTITAKAGDGGDGVVRWLREKFKPFGGPAGGNGGNGGSVYIEGVRDIGRLAKLRYKKDFTAKNGEPGRGKSMHGGSQEDLTIELPVGSVVTNTDTEEVFELLEEGQRIRILKGGIGGLGNEHFKSSVNQKPEQATKGKKGEKGTFYIELKLVVDAGFVGYPNAGKSSLVNALTNAGARVGDYPFTTLDPNLGAFQGYVFADIPGLIEGASEGKGLGHKFLRHVSRTKVVVHCISLERDSVVEAYTAIRKELASYEDLAEKDEYIVLTKSDLVSDEQAQKAKEEIDRETGKNALITSVEREESIKALGDTLVKILRE